VAIAAQRWRSSPRTRLGRRWREAIATASLLGIPVLWLTLFFLVPVGFVAGYSVGLYTLFPGDQGFTLGAWHDFFHGSVYFSILFKKSLFMSLTVSAVCVVIAYPVAYFLALCAGKRRYIFLLALLAPFLTSFLLRVFAWKVILGDQGVINTFAYWTHLRAHNHPISVLLYSRFTVMLVLTYVWIPFVALPIFVSLDTLDRHLLEAASDLGASRLYTFRRIVLPLSLPGVVAAFVFVFIPTVGEFVTPLLVGGNSGYMYGNAIADLFGPGFDWKTGSVLALFLLAVVFAAMTLFARFVTVRRVTT
jgi:spermidine/putrescine transport system permease protein